MHGDTNGARLIGDGTGDGLAYPPRRVGGEFITATIFELVHRLHQADIALLNKVKELQAAIGVLLGNRDHQAQVGLGHLAFGAARFGLAIVHLAIDVLDVLEGKAYARLQIVHFLLLLNHMRLETREHFAPRVVGFNLTLHPAHTDFLARKFLDEVRARHVGLVHAQIKHIALVTAHFLDQFTHGVAQRFNLLGGEADVHQLIGNVLACFQISGAAHAVLGECAHHALIVLADNVKTLGGFFLKLQQVGGLCGRGAGFVLFLINICIGYTIASGDVALGLFIVFAGGSAVHGAHDFFIRRIGVDQAIHHFINAYFVLADAIG